MGYFDNFGHELRSRNFGIYGQWTGILSMIVCLATGISSIFAAFGAILLLIFAICAICSGLLIIFIEIPFLLKICPTSEKFGEFVKKFQSNYGRAAIYLVMSVIQWVSLAVKASSLIAAAVLLLFTSIFYALAGMKKQEFRTSKMLASSNMINAMV